MNDESKKPVGRPEGYRAKNPASKTLSPIRVTEAQQNAYKKASERDGFKTLSAWIKSVLDKAS